MNPGLAAAVLAVDGADDEQSGEQTDTLMTDDRNEGPVTSRWLWILAGAAGVIGLPLLVAALVSIVQRFLH